MKKMNMYIPYLFYLLGKENCVERDTSSKGLQAQQHCFTTLNFQREKQAIPGL